MTRFIDILTGNIFESELELRKQTNRLYPSIITEKCLPENIKFLIDGEKPEISDLEKIESDGFELINNRYFTKWKVVKKFQSKLQETKYLKTLEEERWTSIRAKRNQLLSDSDWIVTKSIEMNNEIPISWKQYRQDLRDITNKFSETKDVIFPLKPE